MKVSISITISVISLLAATIVSIAALIHGAGKFEWNLFYLWVVGPYILLGLFFAFPRHQTFTRSIAGSIASVVVMLFTCLLYIDAMWFSVSSTSALIFLFAPAYILVGGILTWGLAWSAMKK